MKFFLTENLSKETDSPLHKVTNSYIELEFPTDYGAILIYLIARDANSFFVCTCWEHYFDEIITALADLEMIEIINDTYPNFAFFLDNGLNGKFKEGALIRLQDEDYGEEKWFISTIAGNLQKSEGIEDFLNQERIIDSMRTVIKGSLILLKELNENKPNTGKFIWKGVKKGVGIGLFAGILAAFGIPPIE